MDMEPIVKAVRHLFAQDASGHDFWHTMRVYRSAMTIADTESCDRDVVALGALLHDADDRKLFTTENYANARMILRQQGAVPELEERVIGVIKTVSFGGGSVVPDTIEGKIVQDADRLDALGAIGAARTFAYGGSHGTPMHDPDCPPRLNMTPEEYRHHRGTSVNHFYEKLFTLKDTMNTESAKRLAESRDRYLREFLEEFLLEWDGQR